MKISRKTETAARFWHHRIGRFLTTRDWRFSLSAAYPKMPGPPGQAVVKKEKASRTKKRPVDSNAPPRPPKVITARIGMCGASCIMIDAAQAVFIDELDMRQIPGVQHPECEFLFGANVKGEVSLTKTQINWALAPERTYPFFMLRPTRRGSLACIVLTESPNRHIVCAPDGNIVYDSIKVRRARDYILDHALEKTWKRAAQLREALARNEHMHEGVSDLLRQKLLDEHAAFLKVIPLDVWLPLSGTGDFEALNNVLAAKPELPISSLRKARDIYLQAHNPEGLS